MKFLTSNQMADILKMTKRGFTKLVHNMNIPYIQTGNTFYFDLESIEFEDFFNSVKLAMSNSLVKPIYSLKDIATRMGKNKKTIKQMLIENDIKMYYSGKKILILLVDIQKLRYSSQAREPLRKIKG